MEFYHQGQHRSWWAPRLITKWLDIWLPKYSGVCKYAVQQGHQHSLMSRPQWGRYVLVVFAQPPSESVRKREVTDTALQKREGVEEGAVGGDAEVNADPDIHPMEWMRNRQHCYDDEMIVFWPLLCPLTDGGGTMMRRLVCHLLSTWEWSSATHPTSCPPTPTNMEIGWWLPLDRDDRGGSKEDLWLEAYACCLQCMAEASTGHGPG